jgi:hypothetical protein
MPLSQPPGELARVSSATSTSSVTGMFKTVYPLQKLPSLEPYLDLGLTTLMSKIDLLPEDVNVIPF